MSRRFKGRHASVQADPHALPGAPVVLDDSNSYLDPLQGGRYLLTLAHRRYVSAGENDAPPDDYVEVKPDPPPAPDKAAQIAALKAQLAALETA